MKSRSSPSTGRSCEGHRPAHGGRPGNERSRSRRWSRWRGGPHAVDHAQGQAVAITIRGLRSAETVRRRNADCRKDGAKRGSPRRRGRSTTLRSFAGVLRPSRCRVFRDAAHVVEDASVDWRQVRALASLLDLLGAKGGQDYFGEGGFQCVCQVPGSAARPGCAMSWIARAAGRWCTVTRALGHAKQVPVMDLVQTVPFFS